MRTSLIIGAGAVSVVALGLAAWRAGGASRANTLGVNASAPTDTATVAPSPLPSASGQGSKARGREEFVGSQACASCHAAQSRAHVASHHGKALVEPTAEMAKARFDGPKFASKLGGLTHFSLQQGAPVVNTPTKGGKRATLPISYVSGVWPLEQYVVATERGKLQSLGVVWDSREASEGGAKWFHAYGAEGIAPDDTLFFTEPAQNWNHVCADCHSTLVERRYDVATDSFDTRWAELSVGCEACHGPGAQHVRAAQAGNVPLALASLDVKFEHSEPWQPSVTGSPTPRPRDDRELQVCAPCHSRRTPIHEGFIASDPFLDSFVPDLLHPERYHADGQVEGEVYEWGSFLQSRMHQAGVNCSDCHDPHSGKTYKTGNALCGGCHEPARFDVPAHTHHPVGKEPLCIDCHMPPATFMQIDERRDHSIRIPRPDHSVKFGTPNACTGCHEEQTAEWAQGWVNKWAPSLDERSHFVEALGRDRQGSLDAPRALRALAQNTAAPEIARATALERLGTYPAAASNLDALRAALASSEPLVVYGAVLGAAELEPLQRVRLLLPLLEHPIRALRVSVGRALASVPASQLPASARSAFERALFEVEQSFEVSASWPETHIERSGFERARGNLDAAEAALETALRLQPCHVEAYINLADLERQRGDEAASEKALRSALECNPKYAAAHHALGLWQVRARQTKLALASLKKASELAPADARFSYVLAVALAGNGEREEAIRVLEATLERRPNDAAALQAVAAYLRDAGQPERAAHAQRRLETLLRE